MINTDAEGRLILADALAYAAREGATRMIDFATLTGAIVVALGEVYAGLFGSDDDWTALVREAADDLGRPRVAHAPARPLPAPDREQGRRPGQLVQQAPGRAPSTRPSSCASSPTALPWCHVDIAGTGMVNGQGTGFGVRLILAVAERLSGAPPA